MLSTVSLLLVTTALSGVMLLVLSSLADSKVDGIREWGQANALAVLALLLFATRGVLPDLFSIEFANAIFLGTASLMVVGFRRHLGLPVPTRLLVAGSLAAFGGVLVFHYVHESTALRIVAMSAYHAATCLAIHVSVPKTAEGRLRYPYAFTRGAALLLGLGHAVRGVFYALDAWQPIAPATANLVFFAIGTLALPALTLGAVMMANARVLVETAWAAEHDHLTGAPSRRGFFDVAERELARIARHGGGLGLLLVDADHFKRINDTFGHAVGDEVLRDLVRRTQETIRRVDYCARLGGEEFGVLLPDAGFEAAMGVAQRLRAALDRSPEAGSAEGGPAYTVSIGLALLEEGESFVSLMRRADAALYAAKEGGRNRVCAAQATAPDMRQGHAGQVERMRA